MIWTALDGWTKLAIPSRTGQMVISPGQSLPDQWVMDRNYNHAWYVFSTDLHRNGSENLWMMFDAVAHSCVVFVNGKQAAAFTIITKLISLPKINDAETAKAAYLFHPPLAVVAEAHCRSGKAGIVHVIYQVFSEYQGRTMG